MAVVEKLLRFWREIKVARKFDFIKCVYLVWMRILIKKSSVNRHSLSPKPGLWVFLFYKVDFDKVQMRWGMIGTDNAGICCIYNTLIINHIFHDSLIWVTMHLCLAGNIRGWNVSSVKSSGNVVDLFQIYFATPFLSSRSESVPIGPSIHQSWLSKFSLCKSWDNTQ